MNATAATTAKEINGVSLFTRNGKIRQRFSKENRLKMLGASDAELATFTKLFAPRRAPYISRRSGAQWQTVHHALTQDEVVKHLLADTPPAVNPLWVGTRAWKRTMHAAIDVDFRGDEADFRQRCRKVENVLLRLGITSKRMLVCPTPSGGRHYRIFFRKPVFTDQLPTLFEMAGLPLAPGQFEVFPSETKGFRLPFGHIPGRSHNPREWIKFIRDYESKRFPRVNWDRMVRRAQNIEHRRAMARSQPRCEPSRKASPQQTKVPHLGIPRGRLLTPGCATVSVGQFDGRPRRARCEAQAARNRIEEIWKAGITAAGTRVSLTKTLAWHLIFVEHHPARIVSQRIIDWVYRTGHTTSKSVREDLDAGTRKVEEQTREIVAWYETCWIKKGLRPRRYLATTELDHIVRAAKALPNELQAVRARFLMDFLYFAKKEGWKSADGYECMPSVDGVIRKWENCRVASRYKPHLDWAREIGLIVLVREKSQRAHRPRTYAVAVPFVGYEECRLSYQDALKYIEQKLLLDAPVSNNVRRLFNHVGYTELVSLVPREFQEQPGDRCEEKIVAAADASVVKIEAGTASENPTVAKLTTTEENYVNASISAGSQEHKHQRCTSSGVAECQAGSVGLEQALSSLAHRPADAVRTPAGRGIQDPPIALYQQSSKRSGGSCRDLVAGKDQCHSLGLVASGVCNRPDGNHPVIEPLQVNIDSARGSSRLIAHRICKSYGQAILSGDVCELCSSKQRRLLLKPACSIVELCPDFPKGTGRWLRSFSCLARGHALLLGKGACKTGHPAVEAQLGPGPVAAYWRCFLPEETVVLRPTSISTLYILKVI